MSDLIERGYTTGKTGDNRLLAWLAIVSLMLGLAASPAHQALAQDAELNPVHVSGTVTLDGVPMQRVFIRATGVGGGTTLGTFFPDATSDKTSVDYDIIVNVPSGGSKDYDVQACYIQLETTLRYENLCWPLERITVIDGTPAELDLAYMPAFIEGEITATEDTIASVFFVGKYYDPSGSYLLYPSIPRLHFRSQSSNALDTASWSYRIVVPPGKLELTATATLTDSGARPNPVSEVTLAAGETGTVDFSVAPPVGQIIGEISMTGPEPVTRHSINASNSAGGVSTSVTADGPYEIKYVPDASYNLFASTIFDNGAVYAYGIDEFSTGRSVTIADGNTVTVDISSQQAFIEGAITLTESATNGDLLALRPTYHAWVGEANGANAYATVTELLAGTYNSVASPGSWQLSTLFMVLERSGAAAENNFRETLYIFPKKDVEQYFTVVEGETLTKDIEVPMGKATVKLTVSDGSLLSNPNLQLGCTLLDAEGGLLVSYSGTSVGSNQNNVSEGVVSFLAPEGSCWVDARATVGGVSTSFGRIEDVLIEPGSDVVVENQGPKATISYPEPGITVSTSPITVEGLAWDDGSVVSASVNGIDATLGAEDAEGKIPFSASVPLASGENTIALLVIDDTDKKFQSSRVIFYEGASDNTPPEVTPPDDIEVASSSEFTEVDLGTATALDDQDGELTPSPDNAGPFPLGETTVTWSATDSSGNTGSATQLVTILKAYPFDGFFRPVANMPRINKAKAGRTYPIKWRIDYGNEYERDLSIVTKLSVGPVPCEWNGEDYQDTELSRSAKPGLRYSNDDEQYTYSWKTKKNMKGCYVFALELDDGSVHNAMFKFR